MLTLLATVLAALAVTTGPAVDVTATSATLAATVEGEAESVHFEYGTRAGEYGLTAPADPATLRARVDGLTAATTYHYRAVATGPDGPVYGEDASFTTAANPRPPGVSRQRVRDVRPGTARLTARVNPRGTPAVFYFEWGTTRRYGQRTPVQSAGAGSAPVPVSAPIAGLAARTRYHFRLVATNAAGSTRGRDRTFRTSRLPTAISLDASPRTVTWGRGLALGGRVSGVGLKGTPLALEAQRFPFDGGFSEVARTRASGEGGYLFAVANLWAATRYRVVSRTKVVATSAVVHADSAVLVGARARRRGTRRMRISGSVFPAVAGRASLQRRARGGRWTLVRRRAIGPADDLRSRYGFTVRRERRARRYRVVVMPDDGGAHVRGESRTVRVKRRPR